MRGWSVSQRQRERELERERERDSERKRQSERERRTEAEHWDTGPLENWVAALKARDAFSTETCSSLQDRFTCTHTYTRSMSHIVCVCAHTHTHTHTHTHKNDIMQNLAVKASKIHRS